jgi:hypothetical protein
MLSSLNYIAMLESHILPKSCTLLLLWLTQEASPLGYVENIGGYMEDTKKVVQAEKGYAHETLGYAAEASTSRLSLYHLGKRQGPSDTSLEAS